MKKYIALGGTLVAAALAALAIAVWPASETDAAVAEFNAAVADTRVDAGNALAEQIDDQTDAWTLGADVDYLLDQAADFRSQGPEVNRAFWDGFESGAGS